jgi:hypothetical protein
MAPSRHPERSEGSILLLGLSTGNAEDVAGLRRANAFQFGKIAQEPTPALPQFCATDLPAQFLILEDLELLVVEMGHGADR